MHDSEQLGANNQNFPRRHEGHTESILFLKHTRSLSMIIARFFSQPTLKCTRSLDSPTSFIQTQENHPCIENGPKIQTKSHDQRTEGGNVTSPVSRSYITTKLRGETCIHESPSSIARGTIFSFVWEFCACLSLSTLMR